MCTPWFSINHTQFYDRSATLAATSLAALIVMMACGPKDAQAHSLRAVASPPFLWTDVDSTHAQGVATALSEELGSIHDFGHDTFLGIRFSAGVIADFDDKGSELRSGQRHSLRFGNGSSLGTPVTLPTLSSTEYFWRIERSRWRQRRIWRRRR